MSGGHFRSNPFSFVPETVISGDETRASWLLEGVIV